MVYIAASIASSIYSGLHHFYHGRRQTCHITGIYGTVDPASAAEFFILNFSVSSMLNITSNTASSSA